MTTGNDRKRESPTCEAGSVPVTIGSRWSGTRYPAKIQAPGGSRGGRSQRGRKTERERARERDRLSRIWDPRSAARHCSDPCDRKYDARPSSGTPTVVGRAVGGDHSGWRYVLTLPAWDISDVAGCPACQPAAHARTQQKEVDSELEAGRPIDDRRPLSASLSQPLPTQKLAGSGPAVSSMASHSGLAGRQGSRRLPPSRS